MVPSGCALAIVALFAPSLGIAQDSADELAKKLANPVSSLISVPIQYNVDFDIGSENGTKHYVNVQPVIPHSLNEHMNLITRVIVPVLHQDDVFGDSGSQFGLGDINRSFFFSPKEPVGGWIVAAGPVFLLPTATDELLGGEKWGAGPTVLALQQSKEGWTYGALVNHIWSFAGNDDRSEISNTFLQPFVSKTLPGGRTVTLNLESSYDWVGEHWNVPVNLGYSQVTQWSSRRLSWQVGVRYFVETPGQGPDWGCARH